MSELEFDPFADDEEEEFELYIDTPTSKSNKYRTKAKFLKQNNKKQKPKKCVWVSVDLHAKIKEKSMISGVYMNALAKDAFETILKKRN